MKRVGEGGLSDLTWAFSELGAASERASAVLDLTATEVARWIAKLKAEYAAACTAYKQRFGVLPGSESTARLRKKRRNFVLRWWLTQSEGVSTCAN